MSGWAVVSAGPLRQSLQPPGEETGPVGTGTTKPVWPLSFFLSGLSTPSMWSLVPADQTHSHTHNSHRPPSPVHRGQPVNGAERLTKVKVSHIKVNYALKLARPNLISSSQDQGHCVVQGS